MVRLLVHELMTRRGVSAYALSRGANLSYPSAYRLSRPEGRFGRLNADTLERLCTFFKVQPGALLEWVPANGRSQSRSGAGGKKAPAGRSRRPASVG